MNHEDTIQHIRRSLVEEGQSDAIGLWAVLWQAKSEMPGWTPEESKAATLEILREALHREELVVGDFREHDQETAAFEAWPSSVTDALDRIDAAWPPWGVNRISGRLHGSSLRACYLSR